MARDDTEAYALAAARRLGLTLSDESRDAVIANLKILQGMAAQFDDIELDQHVDPVGLLRL